jgi:hypothetical protein
MFRSQEEQEEVRSCVAGAEGPPRHRDEASLCRSTQPHCNHKRVRREETQCGQQRCACLVLFLGYFRRETTVKIVDPPRTSFLGVTSLLPILQNDSDI